MDSSDVKCPLCGGVMEVGFLMDRMHGGQMPGEWVEGTPEKSFWRGTALGGRRRFVMDAWRCADCGQVLLFAKPESDAS